MCYLKQDQELYTQNLQMYFSEKGSCFNWNHDQELLNLQIFYCIFPKSVNVTLER